ncbi:MAG TPA: S9 family peptidase [Prolixibacteraceae bacterium]|nr:S9 family peptidase [Prolixibacteraceae bacterium]
MKHILLSFFAILLVFSVYAQPKKQLALEDFVTNNTFKAEKFPGVHPMNDGIHFSMLKSSSQIVLYSFKTGEQESVLFDLKSVADCSIESFDAYTFSMDEQRILLETNKKRIYRHSYTAEYYVWDIKTRALVPLSAYGPQRLATFSPDGERVAFVRDNNLFIKTLKFSTEFQITNDGKANEIANGVPDWVQEEEFSYTKAFEWSPDSKMLAFLKFDEKEVPSILIPEYKGLEPEKAEFKVYPGVDSLKYPKAGERNSVVTVHVYDVKTKATIRVKTGEDTDVYFPRIEWIPTGSDLAVMKLNRHQNEVELLYANPYTGDTRPIMREKNKYYLDETYFRQFTFLDDNENFVVLSERDGWAHLYLYKNSGYSSKQLTLGNFDVTDFYGYDKVKKMFYYQAAKKSPLQREVYAVSLDGKKEYCLSENEGTNDAVFSSNFQYLINTFSSHLVPTRVSVCDLKGKEINVLEDNSVLTKKLDQYIRPSFEFFTFKTSEGTQLNGYMIKPSSFDPAVKYPVVMTQYTGPNSQEVADDWQFDWHNYLAERGFIIVCVDPRGTAARGEDFRKCTYMQLGKLESDDMVEAAQYISSLSYVDARKIGIWGWSHGGYMTIMSMEKGGSLFKAGVAVAPVTSWRFYDNVYTERFMRQPFENPDGYKESSPINHPEMIKGHLLLVHGTADDNVHAQNTYEFAEALVQAGVQFDMQLYTNRNHSIYGGNTRMHLYTKIINYFEQYLK